MKNKKKLLGIIAGVLIAVVLGVLAYAGNFLVTYAIGRAGDGGNRQVALKVDDSEVEKTSEARSENSSAQSELTKAFYENVEEREAAVLSQDSLTLRGGWYTQPSHRWAIVIHGYRGNHYGMLNYAQRYYDAGFQVLAPDLRGCGSSEGDYIGMGWPDRLDMLSWIDWILEQDPEAEIILHGVSMGGATVMMTSGENTPDAVKAFVEDCGYSSVWGIFSSELKLRFGLPEFPVLYAANMVSSIRAGYNFTEASSVDQVANCEKPMLFIHGDQDNFVPYSMLAEVYDAKPGENKLAITVQGAGHGLSASVLGDAYWDSVFAFIEAYL